MAEVRITRAVTVALTKARTSRTTLEVRDADRQGDVWMSVRPGDENEAGVYMSREDARVLAFALMEAAK